ncbi:MAG TPA: ComF family protein [Bacillales bacterium]|nr:ComF family protein [Bacillales bacterium]
MAYCLWCDEKITESVSWHEVFGLSRQETLCRGCRTQLKILSEPLCRICGRSLDELDAAYRHGDICYDCVRWEEGEWAGLLKKNRSLYTYNPFLKDVVARFKFRGDAVMVQGFEREWSALFERDFLGHLPVPIPLSRERLYERGFNQALELARLLPVSPCEALERVANEPKQSKKTRLERLSLDRPVFRCARSPEIQEKRIVLIDDIYTTGSTVRRAAKVLLECGAASVSSMTVARG